MLQSTSVLHAPKGCLKLFHFCTGGGGGPMAHESFIPAPPPWLELGGVSTPDHLRPRVQQTLCPTNTSVQIVFFEDLIPPPLAQAQACPSTQWALNRRFSDFMGPLFFSF